MVPVWFIQEILENVLFYQMESMGHQLAEFRRLVESGQDRCITVYSDTEAEGGYYEYIYL